MAQFISSKFEELRKRNPRLSLRAVARKAGISAGRFSEIIAGKRKLSSYYADKIADAMRLSQNERNELFSYVETSSRKKLSSRVLQEREIAMITGWENYAILSLMKTQDFRSESEWIADRLGITKSQVEKSLGTMESLGIIKKNSLGYVRTSESFQTMSEIPSRHLRQVHHNELAKALEVMENTPVSVRSFSSATMPVNLNRLAEAKKMILEFQNSLMQFLEQGEKTEVYNFNMQLFPLTDVRKKSS
ncbi:TIGR02147 family protein [Bdellovibrio sp. HCB2-146]|uniref:TIGR02147 family protein n=1 Tax=Bdellovibrio sp. HCB2-146 TaxID=3394362 RepID=UPI0039BCC056